MVQLRVTRATHQICPIPRLKSSQDPCCSYISPIPCGCHASSDVSRGYRAGIWNRSQVVFTELSDTLAIFRRRDNRYKGRTSDRRVGNSTVPIPNGMDSRYDNGGEYGSATGRANGLVASSDTAVTVANAGRFNGRQLLRARRRIVHGIYRRCKRRGCPRGELYFGHRGREGYTRHSSWHTYSVGPTTAGAVNGPNGAKGYRTTWSACRRAGVRRGFTQWPRVLN